MIDPPEKRSGGSASAGDAAPPSAQRSLVILGMGANLGDPPAQLRTAVELLSSCVAVDAISSVYLTEPVGVRSQPEFANIVLRGRTGLPVRDLLAQTQAIERQMGRTEGVRYGPRIIDIDLLAYDEVVVASEALVIPHAWLHRRSFVLVPLVEIAPEWRHPVLGVTAVQMLSELKTPTRVKRLGHLDALAATLGTRR
jgi:2-amino-4-hydroxy-6-hydroxymethyldihydropteridine diphosphokinase